MFDDEVFRIAAHGFTVALITALLVMPGCILLARRFGIVDKPGGRKTHEKTTPLLGGLGVVVAAAAGYAVVAHQAAQLPGHDLGLEAINFVIAGSLVLFLIGLVDDIFKDSMDFQPKLIGQIVGVVVLMWPTVTGFMEDGIRLDKLLFMLFFLGWYLTIVNSFNFSDNMNGLMSGLAVIAFLAAIMYLQNTESLRSMVMAALLIGALLGFMPYNFPRSRIFLGDTGSLFIGFWMAWVQFDLVAGFMGGNKTDFGASHLVPAVLIMGVPLFDAAFVVFMRIKEGRPVYLGDNHHLSHRLVRGGFSATEGVVILWGLGLILAWVGILATDNRALVRYLILFGSLIFMIGVTRRIMMMERTHSGQVGGRFPPGARILGAGPGPDERVEARPEAGEAEGALSGPGTLANGKQRSPR